MKRLLILALFCAGCGTTYEQPLNVYERQSFDGLMGPQPDDEFERRVNDAVNSASLSSVTVLAHAMTELKEPRRTRVHQALDKLVTVAEFDTICANFMSGADNGQRVRDWVKRERHRLSWDAISKQFVIPEQK